MDEKDVPVTSQAVHGLLKPAQWYLVARSDKNLNRDTNGGVGSIRSMTLTTIDDIAVHKSNIASKVFGADDSANAAIPAPYRAKFGTTVGPLRSEERRVGNECVGTCRSLWWRYNLKKKK